MTIAWSSVRNHRDEHDAVAQHADHQRGHEQDERRHGAVDAVAEHECTAPNTTSICRPITTNRGAVLPTMRSIEDAPLVRSRSQVPQ